MVQYVWQNDIDVETAVGFGIDGDTLDVDQRHRFQIYRPKNAAIVPVIAAPLRPVNTGVGRLIIRRHFQQIFPSLQQVCDVVFEFVISP